MLDFCLAMAAVPFVVFLGLVCALAIRWETPGNPLFIQSRVGRHQKPFRLVKLRTMFAETGDHPSHSVGAAQITRVGRVLRRTKLDELPQIWNILLGDMAFVGPRPCLPSQKELIDARSQRGVYDIRPGITGPAQLAGIDMSNPSELAEIDAGYLKNRSFWTDIKLIAMTIVGGGTGDAAGRADAEGI